MQLFYSKKNFGIHRVEKKVSLKRSKHILAWVLTVLCVVQLPFFTAPAKAEGAAAVSGDIVILHTNDVHCGVDQVTKDGNVTNIGYASVAAYKKEMQEKYGASNVTLVDAGDAIQGGNIGSISHGAYIINIMNDVGYDIAVPGNHEFDYGFQRFMDLVKQANYPYICSNLTTIATGKTVLDPYKIVSYGDKKVAYVGIDTPESFTKSTPAYFQDKNGHYLYSFAEDATGQKLYQTVQNTVNTVRNAGANYVVAIGHLGETGSTPRWQASAVIANTEGIDIFLDGHSHEQYEKDVPNKAGKLVAWAQTGTQLATIGEVVIDTSTGKITHQLISGYSKQDPDVAKDITDIESQYKSDLEKVVGTTTVNLVTEDPNTGKRRVRSGETNLGDLCADAYRQAMGADIAFVNGGNVRTDIAKGPITAGKILSVFPFGNQACLVKLSGQQVLDALEFASRNYPNECGGFLQVSGVTYTINQAIKPSIATTNKQEFVKVNGPYRVQNVKVNGVPLDLKKTYTLASHDYMLKEGGDGFTMFGKNVQLVRDCVMVDTDVLTNYITNELKGTVGNSYENPYGTGRIQIVSVVPSASAVSDTNGAFSVANGKAYQFKITSKNGRKPAFSCGSPCFKTVSTVRKGNVYYINVKASGRVGDGCGFYVNGVKTAVAKITPIPFTSDTHGTFGVQNGSTYQFKITSGTPSSFTCGSPCFRKVSTVRKGNVYYIKVKASGRVGNGCGFYVNDERTAVAVIR